MDGIAGTLLDKGWVFSRMDSWRKFVALLIKNQ